jgi:hypothetical protein
MEAACAWFDATCTELSVNPQVATEKLMVFRDSDEALGVSMSILNSISCSPNTQFQGLLILQHVFLKQWELMSQTERESLKGLLWTKLTSGVAMTNFVRNKTTQAFALIWKRGWVTSGGDEKASLFTTINSSVQSSVLSLSQAAVVLRAVIEEFSGKSSAEIGAPLQFHKSCHAAFESSGLDSTFQLGMGMLSSSLEALSTAGESQERFSSVCSAITDTSNLMVEVLSWDFGG